MKLKNKKSRHIIGIIQKMCIRDSYIGEAGVGIFHYDGNANFTSIYPERLGYIGDIDLIGNRRPKMCIRDSPC